MHPGPWRRGHLRSVSSDPGGQGGCFLLKVTSGTFPGAIWPSCHRGSSANQLAWGEGQHWGWTFIPQSSRCDSFPCRCAEAAPGAEPWSPLVGPRPVSQLCVYVCVCALGVELRSPGSGPARPGLACPQSWAPAHTAGLLWLFPVDETSGFWARASHPSRHGPSWLCEGEPRLRAEALCLHLYPCLLWRDGSSVAVLATHTALRGRLPARGIRLGPDGLSGLCAEMSCSAWETRDHLCSPPHQTAHWQGQLPSGVGFPPFVWTAGRRRLGSQ